MSPWESGIYSVVTRDQQRGLDFVVLEEVQDEPLDDYQLMEHEVSTV